MNTRYEMYSEEWYQWEAISKMVKQSEDEKLKREDRLQAAEREKERVRQAVINNDRMDYEMYLERKREKERLVSEARVVVAEAVCKSEVHVHPIKDLLIGGGKDEEDGLGEQKILGELRTKRGPMYLLQPHIRHLDHIYYALVKFLFRRRGMFLKHYFQFDKSCVIEKCGQTGHVDCSCTMMVEGLGQFKGYAYDIEIGVSNVKRSCQNFADDLVDKYGLKEGVIVSKFDIKGGAVSRMHPSLFDGLAGGKSKARRQYEKESHVMDSILGGKKRSRVVYLQMSPNLFPVERWVDLVKILKDEYYILLDETLELDTKGTVKILLEVYSHVDQILACKKPDAQPLRDIILPYVRCLEKQCAARHIFRCRGGCLETYFLAEILSTDRCDVAKAHSKTCACTLRIRGINSLYGYASEFSMNNESSRLQFLADLNERFDVKKGKVQVRGTQQGFEFSQKNCFDLFCNETRLQDRGGSVLTSVKYVEMNNEGVVVEKTRAQIIICLAPGKYDFIAVPTAKKPNDKLIDYFDQLRTVRGVIEAEAEVIEGITKVHLVQKMRCSAPAATSSGILKLKTGRCMNVVESEEEQYWIIAWRRVKNLAFSETKYISVLHCLLPRDDMKGCIAVMKSKIDLDFCYETVPSCANY
jgi:hypothetical protein